VVTGQSPIRDYDRIFFSSPRAEFRSWDPPNLVFSENKLLGLVTDHSHPSRAEIKNAWSIAFTPPYKTSWHGA